MIQVTRTNDRWCNTDSNVLWLCCCQTLFLNLQRSVLLKRVMLSYVSSYHLRTYSYGTAAIAAHPRASVSVGDVGSHGAGQFVVLRWIYRDGVAFDSGARDSVCPPVRRRRMSTGIAPQWSHILIASRRAHPPRAVWHHINQHSFVFGDISSARKRM